MNRRKFKAKILTLNEGRDANVISLALALAWSNLDSTQRSRLEAQASLMIEAMRRQAGQRWL